jgi:hypothetical protein
LDLREVLLDLSIRKLGECLRSELLDDRPPPAS